MPPKIVYYIIGSLLIIILLAYICFYKYVNLFIVSITGKKRIQKILYKQSKINDFLIINDIWLPVDDNKIKHIDTIIFGNKYIYITSIVTQAGEVKINVDDAKWRVIYNDELTLIDNPFIYNKKIIKRLANVVSNLKEEDMKSLVVLSKTCLCKEKNVSNIDYVALENEAINMIVDIEKKSDDDVFDPMDVEKYAKAFYEYGEKCEKHIKNK